jgi:hypothetical protein
MRPPLLPRCSRTTMVRFENGFSIRPRGRDHGPETLHDDRLADIGLGDDQRVDVEVVVVLGIGDRRFQRLLDVEAMRLREKVRSASAARPSCRGSWRNQVQLLRADADAGNGTRLVVASRRSVPWACPWLLPLCLLVRAVTVIGPRRSEFTELVADHVFIDGDRNVLLCRCRRRRSGRRTAA